MRDVRWIVLGLALLAAVGAGCRRGRNGAVTTGGSSGSGGVLVDAGLVRVRSPIVLSETSQTEDAADGVSTRTRVWEGRTAVFAIAVIAVDRAVPFTGPRDEILIASLGDRVREGELGPITFDYGSGLFRAQATGRGDGTEVQVQAYMSRTRLVVLICGGRAPVVASTLGSIDVTSRPDELFYMPASGSDDELHVAWALGFSCRMPGGLTYAEGDRGRRYTASGGGRSYEVYVHHDAGVSVEEQRAEATARGVTVEDVEDFDGGTRRRRVVVQVGTAWHAWLITRYRSFHVSGEGSFSARDHDDVGTFFSSCVY